MRSLLLVTFLLGCPTTPMPERPPAPDPEPEEGVAPIPVGLFDPAAPASPSPVTASGAPRVIPRDPWAPPTTIRNHPERCKEFSALAPSLAEDGQWAAVRLVPPRYPFAVQRAEVVLAHGTFNMSTCDATHHYLMRLYVVPVDAPPPDGDGVDPVTPYEYDFFERPEQHGDRALSASVSPPIVLQDGESLIVAIDTHNRGGPRTCVKTCLEGERNDRTFWSNDRDPARWAWSPYKPSRGSGMWATAEGK